MTTIAALAAEYSMQPYELQAYADLNDTDLNDTDQDVALDAATEEFVRDLMDNSNGDGIYRG